MVVASMVYPLLIIALYLLLLTGLWLKPKEWEKLMHRPKLVSILPQLFLGAVGLAFVIRFPLYGEAPFGGDLALFKAWAQRMADTGPLHFYAPGVFCDYPPFSLYLYWAIGSLIKLPLFSTNEWLIRFLLKLPAFICDAATAWMIFLLIMRKNPVWGWILSVIYLLLPAVVYNSSYWGQVDTFYTFLLMVVFYLLTQKRPEWAAVCLAASFLTKAQTLAFFPLLLFYLVLNYDWKCWIRTILAGLFAFILIVLPFNLHQSLTWIVDQYSRQAALYPYATLNAGNFLALLDGNGVNDAQPILYGISYRTLALTLFAAGILGGCWYYRKRRTKGGLAAAFAMTAFAFFLLCPRMHERYLFPILAFLLLLVGYTKDKKIFFLTLIVNLSYFFNMHAVVLRNNSLLNNTELNRVLYILGLVHTALFIAIWIILRARIGRGRALQQWFAEYSVKFRENLAGITHITPFSLARRDYLILGAILIVYTLLIFIRLGSWSTPKKGWVMSNPQTGVEVIFRHPANMDSVAIYDAEGDGALLFECFNGGKPIGSRTFTTNEYYVLKHFKFPVQQVERIRITPHAIGGTVNEIAFFDTDRQLISVEKVKSLNGLEICPEKHPLFDEPGMMGQKSTNLNSTYFDEIYHGRTAYEFVTGSPVYETTHPPLGKDLLSLGILLFGMNPFGMRFVHAIMGILLLLALFFLGRQVLATRFGAYGVMLLGMFDFMPLVQSRYATVDTTSVLCISLMFLFAFKFFREQEKGISVIKSLPTIVFLMISFGMAASIKWTAVYGFAGVIFCIILIKLRQFQIYRRERRTLMDETVKTIDRAFWSRDIGLTILILLMAFLLIVPTIYYVSYIPYLNCQGIKNPFSALGIYEVYRNQLWMFGYHSKLTATHPFGSSWWSWPFDFKPLFLYQAQDVAAGLKGSIVSLGNPFIWWLGVIALVVLGYHLITDRRFSLMFLVFVGFLSLYLPWVLVSRVTFIYHFYPVLPLYLIMAAFILEPVWTMGSVGKKLIYQYFIVCALLLIMFYPTLTGLEVPQAYVDRLLRWFPNDWIF